MRIIAMTNKSEYWEKTAELADKCEWRAGPSLARLMRGGGFSGFERVFCALDGGSPAAFCTLAKKDCLENVHYTPFIGFVYVSPEYRGKRLSESLIRAAAKAAKEAGFSKIYICSGEKGLYEKYGFAKLGDMKDKYGYDEQIFVMNI